MAVDPKRIQPQGDRVLCRRPPHVNFTGIIFTVGGKNNDTHISEVLALGPAVKARKWDLNVGDYVLHTRVAGVKYDGVDARAMGDGELVFLRESELIASMPPDMVERVKPGTFSYDSDGVGDTTRL